ncbi:glycine N-acyltransferase-like protein 2 isoform X2 [Cimex lectularius]|nr:glycine N-acyltransferase-like protein 2 isoform X2 [Cimex lectularius]XP_024084162.1 glycine N-acyltransferase-like protein 2 isoform X2 [Cimex lectularius]
MEVRPEGKNFRLVKVEELPEIQEFLSKFLPYSLKFHQTILTYLKDKVWDFYFYVAKDWPSDPIILHFPGMTSTPNNQMYESFSVFCPVERLDCMELLRTEDVLIDWTQPIYLNFTHIDVVKAIGNFESVGKVDKIDGDIYVQTDPPPEELVLEDLQADEYEVLELKEENAKAIHDLYPANDMECVEVFERLIRILPAYGVFTSGEKGDLAAWMVQSYYGAMFSMQTRPEYRRKGFGIRLASALTRKVRSRGYIPFVVIRPENDASLSLYNKLGFIRSYPTARAVIYPKVPEKHEIIEEEKDKTEKEVKEED